MPIDAALHNFDLMKRSAAYEFAKARNEFENASTAAQVDAVVGQVAKRLDTTPEIARTLLAQDGWTSKFEAGRPAGALHAEQSRSAGAAADFGVPVGVAGQTAARLGGLRDWRPGDGADAFAAKLQDNEAAMTKMFGLAGASMSSNLGNVRATADDAGFKVTADVVNFMSGAKESEVAFKVSADMKSIERVKGAATAPTAPTAPTTPTTPGLAAHWARAATAEETAFADKLKHNEEVTGALFMATGGSMSSNISNITARKVGDGWDVHADVVNFMTGSKEGDASVKLDATGAVT